MNSRRSRSVKLLSSRAKPLEVDVAEEDPRMSSSADNTVYCCIAKGNKVIYSYSSKDGDSQTEATALCLENVPPYHRHYIHTSGSRSYGYLMADGHTNTNRNGFHDALVPAVQRLVASLEKMPRATLVPEGGAKRGGSNDGSSCTSSKVPLLGKGSGRKDKKKAKEKGMPMGDGGVEHHGTRGVRIDMQRRMLAACH
ncbi:hypothetical protein ZWY2020_003342 [Hordeum vulgare]|nr:hypothetical protein ZWY2020_003342 [Hordeum vulgare]